MKVEIEINSPDFSGNIYEFRSYLEKNLKDLHLEVQPQPAKEGQMGGELDWLDPFGMGIMHGLWVELGKGGVTMLVQGGKKVYELYREWKKTHPAVAGPQPGKSSSAYGQFPAQKPTSPFRMTMGEGDNKVYLFEDANGELKVYNNFDFSLIPEKTYALLVGTSEFSGEFTAIPPVRSNLVDFYNLITDRGHVGIPRENVEVLLNKSAEDIQTAMLKMSRKEGMNTFILYYSGHGYKVDLHNLVLVANNTKKVDDDIIAGIPLNFITEKVLKRSTAKQKILILDACHSGLATQGDGDILKDIEVEGTYILTSSGDEPSFFEKKSQHTFFTGAILNLLSRGIGDETKEMISLDDVYKFSSQSLESHNFPKPQFSSKLNIFPSSFFIARNPYFSEEKYIRLPKKMMDEKRFEDALSLCKKMIKRYPENDELRRWRDQCQDEIDFIQYALDGDKCYFVLKNYKDAVKNYENALNIKQDDIIRKKINECKKLLEGSAPPPPLPAPSRGGESYEFQDEALVINFDEQLKKPPLRIPYAAITTLIDLKKQKNWVITFKLDASPTTRNIQYGSLPNAAATRTRITSKASLKLQAKPSRSKDIVAFIIVYAFICLIYIALTNWAKSYVYDHDGEKGIGMGIATILDTIGSFITPTVAVIIVLIILFIGIIGMVQQQNNQPDTFKK